MDDISSLQDREEAVFTINGKLFKAGSGVPLTTSLNTFIRDYALLTGTKYMCKEGSCGSCVVNIKYTDTATKKSVSKSANSCLLPVFACHGYAITTVEGLGSRAKSYNKIQTTLAHFSGTQCGFCSPGFVMSMYSLLDENPKATVDQVENNFSGNLCRCTGYRPILDAFKSLSSNPPTYLKQRLLDIEECHVLCPKNGKCDGSGQEDRCRNCFVEIDDDSFELDFSELTLAKDNLYLKGSEAEWYRACCLKEIFEIFDRIGNKKYILLAGNTAVGVKKPSEEPEVYIDINRVTELNKREMRSDSIVFGSVTRQNDCINMLKSAASNQPNLFRFGQPMSEHLLLVASVPLRNRATLGGSLALSNYLKNFPSDIFLLFDAIGATITIATQSGITRVVSPTEFSMMDLRKKVITQIKLPAQTASSTFLSYKIMPVSQTALAIVNAAFLYDIDKNGRLNKKPSLVFSGINQSFRHAYNTENYLSGKNIFNPDVLLRAISTLYHEVIPDDDLMRESPAYRKLLATALFYRSILKLSSDRANVKLRSGADNLIRPISSGKQVYQIDEKEYPLTEAIPKLEAQAQCSGEASYINDIEKQKRELVGHLVLAKKFADIQHVDASKALKIPGVVAYFSAKDIPGENNICFPFVSYFVGQTELFSSGKINFWGQPVGMIVAETEYLAERGANEVVIVYKTVKRPLLNIRDVLSSKEKDKRVQLQTTMKAKTPGSGGKYNVVGEVDIVRTGQYVHAMETPTCRVETMEDGQFRAYVSTQTITVTANSIAQVMNTQLNKIDVIVPRVGGSFGSKNVSQLYGACACSVAAYRLQTPVRMVMTVPAEMDSIGKRTPFYTTYKGKCDDKGVIQGMDIDIYVEYGYTCIMTVYFAILPCIQNYFNSSTWNINVYNVFTDKAPNIILRGPGFSESISTIEVIMDHLAFAAKLSPADVRINNSNDQTINNYIANWRKETDFDSRKQKIDQFNKDNRWKKKGLALSAMKYPFDYTGVQLGCSVSIMYPDGTVQVQHGGIEMGQGLNTKIAQTVATKLEVPLNTVQMKTTNSITCPNATPTWTSTSSELVVFAAIDCCRQLNEALEPVKKSLNNPSWKEIVTNAFNSRVPLSAYVPFGKFPNASFGKYSVYGVCVSEVEIDLLTGQHQITRVDILEDVGKSMSPAIDVGQVEGSFIMALGYLFTEKLIYDPKTGALLNDKLLYYHIPRSKDIPIDFRVTFVPNATNPNGILNSKATGEPAISMGISVVNAIRDGLASARRDAGLADSWIPLDSPCTPETVMMSSGTKREQFIL